MKKTFCLLLCILFVLLTVFAACNHLHTYSDEWTHDETYHWHAATCGHVDETIGKEKHIFEDDYCIVCGAEDIEEDNHEHTFDSAWINDDTYHWHAANCGHNLTADKTEHDFVEGKCTVCNATDPNYVAPHEHTFSDEWKSNGTHHWHAANCGHDLVKDMDEHTFANGRCTVCNIEDPNSEIPHQHVFSSEWSSDTTYHWHATNCGHDEVADKGEHTFVNGKCSVCNATDPGYVVPHEHKYSNEWSSDETHHWHAAICEHKDLVVDKDVHNYVDGICAVCNAIEPKHEDDYPYEFGDAVSINNDKFYEDYSAEEKNLYYTLWSENTTISIKIDITPSELAKINEAFDDYSKGNTAKADTYRRCNLTITVNGKDYYYEEVGIRMRGNTSRRFFLNSSNLMNAFVHFRFSLSETFDGDEYKTSWASSIYHDWSNDASGRKARKNRSFATMEKFYYKWNKNYDQTYIREVYANRMFQAYGILAPHITLTQLSITQNGVMESLGIGNLYETIDKQFIKRNFDKANKGGDLYKCTYTVGPADLTTLSGGVYGVETATQRFTYSLKTNDDRSDPNYNHNKYLKALVDVLNNYNNTSEFKSKLETMIDMDYFARFEAVNYLLGNPDCIRNNSNNYYIYFTPTDDEYQSRAILIPYDYDRCLGANMDWNPQESMVYATPYAIKGWAGTCKNPLYTKTILSSGLTEYKEMYRDSLQMVLDGQWFTYETYQQLYLAYKANYQGVAMPSDVIVTNCGRNVQMSRFEFSEDGTSNLNSSSNNIAVSNYMLLKRNTALANLYI